MSHATLALLLLFSISTAADQLRYDSARDPEDQVLHFHKARIAEAVARGVPNDWEGRDLQRAMSRA